MWHWDRPMNACFYCHKERGKWWIESDGLTWNGPSITSPLNCCSFWAAQDFHRSVEFSVRGALIYTPNLWRVVCLIFQTRLANALAYTSKQENWADAILGTNSPPAEVYRVIQNALLCEFTIYCFWEKNIFVVSYALSTTLYHGQQNEQPPLPSNHCSQQDHYKLCPWKSKSWFGFGITCGWVKSLTEEIYLYECSILR